MRKRKPWTTTAPTTRFVVYAGLGFGTILFAFPLLWMLATSLSPIEQTVSYPPRLLPLAHYALVEGQRLEVTMDAEVHTRSAFVQTVSGLRAGVRKVIPLASYDAADGSLRLLKVVEPGSVQVTERSRASKSREKDLRRDVVPRHAIETTVKFRWDNYPKALAAMGGRSIEEIEGFVGETTRVGKDSEVSFFTFLSNTLIVCVLGVVGTVLSNAIVAYGFARLKWRGRDAFFALTLATMMIPYPVLMVPLFGMFQKLGWIGTLLPLWVPTFFGNAFNIFLMRQFFRTIPGELSEAARLDGCSEWRIFWQIVLPLCKPVLAVAALFHFLYAWNDFLGPLLYLTRKHTFTLGLALQDYQTTHGGVQWHFLMAASAVTILPVIVLFLLTQRTFIRGVATTGSKG
jgi:multiple sugar transport system permease protein